MTGHERDTVDIRYYCCYNDMPDDDSEEQAELDMGAKELEMGIDTYDPDRGITPSDIPGVILTKFSFPNSSD